MRIIEMKRKLPILFISYIISYSYLRLQLRPENISRYLNRIMFMEFRTNGTFYKCITERT